MTRAWILALALTLAQGMLWWALTPPWTAPDEPGHFLYASLLAELGRMPARSDLTATVEAPILQSLTSTDWWGYGGRAQAERPLERLADDPVLAASGSQVEDEPLFYYLAPALWLRWTADRFGNDVSLALRWLRLWSLGLRMTAVLSALVLGSRYWPDRPQRVLGVALLVGMLPMVGFIGGSFNNDALALAWGAFCFVLLALPEVKRFWPLTALALAIGPLFVDKSLLFLWPLALIWALLTAKTLRPYRKVLLLGFFIIVFIVFIPLPRWAAGWQRFPPLAQNRNSEQALQLRDSRDDYRVRLVQVIADKTVLERRGQQLVLAGDYWGEPGTILGMRLADGQHDAEVLCEVSDQIETCMLPFTLHPHASQVRVLVAIGAVGDPGALGDVKIRLHLLDEQDQNLLFNGDGHLFASLADPMFHTVEGLLPIPPGFFARALAPSAWDAISQFRYFLYAGFTWASFWGYFGWLTRPFPWWTYVLTLFLTLMAGWGIVRFSLGNLHFRGKRSSDPTGSLVLLSGLATLIILVQVWLPMLGQDWQPQGRYLFPALLPIAILLYIGWETIVPIHRRQLLVPLLVVGLVFLNLIAYYIVIKA